MKPHTCLRRALTLAAAFVTSAACLAAPAVPQNPDAAAAPSRPATTDNAPRSTKRQTYPFRGVIGSFDTETRLLTLEGKQGKRLIRLTETTRLERDGRTGSTTDLKRGEKVGGTLKRNPQGEEEALLVRIAPKPSPDDPAEDAGAPPKKEGTE